MAHLPRFLARVADAIGPVASVSRQELEESLDKVQVILDVRGDDPGCAAAALLATNLLARLYPHLRIISGGPDGPVDLARRINPGIDVSHGAASQGSGQARAGHHVTLLLVPATADARALTAPDTVVVTAHGWNVSVDGFDLPDTATAEIGTVPAWLAAACVGVGEVFRTVFADNLSDRGRRGPQPGGFNLVTTEPTTAGLPAPTTYDLGEIGVVGVGAVGQASLLTLASSDVVATVHLVDPEPVELSNLQRYVLTTDDDVGKIKVHLMTEALSDSRLSPVPHVAAWGGDGTASLAAHPLLVALDTAADRIAVAASVPARAYNAWTQPADLGWSRHEAFGDSPCLACLYYPDRPRPSEHELIAHVLEQHPLRMLGYLIEPLPVGIPLMRLLQLEGLPLPPDAPAWLQRSLIDDLVAAGKVSDEERATFADRTLARLYQDGVCGSGLMQLGPPAQERGAVVPLAHQSALAGVMLGAAAMIASDPDLAGHRPAGVEARFDVLRGFPQVLVRPRTRTAFCLCSDPDYLSLATPADLGSSATPTA